MEVVIAPGCWVTGDVDLKEIGEQYANGDAAHKASALTLLTSLGVSPVHGEDSITLKRIK